MDKLKIVKIIVCLLTFLLVFGTLLLFGSIYKKVKHQTQQPSTIANLEQPIGSVVADYKNENGELSILVKNGGLSDRIIIYNLSSGTITSTIYLNKELHNDK